MSNTTRRSVVDHAMPSENTRAERAPDTQETLLESLQKGFSQLTEALSSQLSDMLRQNRPRKRSESSDSDSGGSVSSAGSDT